MYNATSLWDDIILHGITYKERRKLPLEVWVADELC